MPISLWWKILRYFSIRSCRKYQVISCTGCRERTQVMFSTHSPNLLSNFNSRQIRQVFLNEDGLSEVKEKTDISAVLDDLGYSANDLMNVNFVFIVEGEAG